MDPITWYIPSFYGDLRLERSGTKTMLSWEKVTPTERRVLQSLFAHAVTKGWAKETEHDLTKGSLTLSIELVKVQKFVVKALKPGRQTVDFVQFSDGKIEEIRARPAAPGVRQGSGGLRAATDPRQGRDCRGADARLPRAQSREGRAARS